MSKRRAAVVTIHGLQRVGAGDDMLDWFYLKFPHYPTVVELAEELIADNHTQWLVWLGRRPPIWRE
jgi:hypothetical protein